MENNKSNNSKNKNIRLDLMSPLPFYSVWIWIILLLIILIYLFSGSQIEISSSSLDPATYIPSEETTKIIGEIFLIIFFLLIIFVFCLALIPNFKQIKDLFVNISSVSYVIIYTIFLILLFSNIPSSTLNTYPYFFTITTLLIGIFSFYRAGSVNYAKEFNVNYERIKSIILFFCLITVYITFYSVNPGGIISEYGGSALLISILLGVFALLYIIILFTLKNEKHIPVVQTQGNILLNFTKFSYYGLISFFIFLIAVTAMIVKFPGGFFNQSNIVRSSAIIIITLWISILWSILLVSNLFPEIKDNSLLVSKLDLFQRSLLLLFGIVLAILAIMWVCLTMNNLSSTSGTANFIVNLFIILIMLTAIYKLLIIRAPVGNEKKNSFLMLITSILFYIPCLFSNSLDSLTGLYNENKNENHYWNVLIIIIILYITYLSFPILKNKYLLQGGEILINEPTMTNSEITLGNYESLNKNGAITYNYAISFWLFLNSFPQNSSGNKYATIVSYGRKPNIEYNALLNKLRITVKQADLRNATNNKLMKFTADGERIIYIKNKLALQKWTNIILNFDGGTLDIFINGKLVSSSIEVVPYYTLDNLVCGQNNGYIGSICNLIYFQKKLSLNNITVLYNSLKDQETPILKNNYF